MATTYKVLGQVNPAATTDTDLYTVPASTQAVCSTLVVCNTSNSGTTIRVAVRPGGASLTTSHYIIYDSVLSANDSVFLTLGISLAATDVITVRASGSTVTFNLFGTEIS